MIDSYAAGNSGRLDLQLENGDEITLKKGELVYKIKEDGESEWIID